VGPVPTAGPAMASPYPPSPSPGAPSAPSPAFAGPSPVSTPPELASVQSMFPLARIFALVSLIVFAIAAILSLLTIFGIPAAIVYGALAVLSYLLFERVDQIRQQVEGGRYEEAKAQTLPWMVIGLFTLLLPGVFLIIAYLKYDTLINWKRAGSPSGWPGPNPSAPAVPPAGYPASNPFPAPVPVAPVTAPTPPAGATVCPRCGQPLTWIPQYGRWYCYSEQQYL
jgi:hypothetical protein